MVVANCLHATLDLSLSIQLRSRHPLVKLALFLQDFSRRRLTHFFYLHRVLNHHRANMHIFNAFSFVLLLTLVILKFKLGILIFNLRTILELKREKRKKVYTFDQKLT